MWGRLSGVAVSSRRMAGLFGLANRPTVRCTMVSVGLTRCQSMRRRANPESTSTPESRNIIREPWLFFRPRFRAAARQEDPSRGRKTYCNRRRCEACFLTMAAVSSAEPSSTTTTSNESSSTPRCPAKKDSEWSSNVPMLYVGITNERSIGGSEFRWIIRISRCLATARKGNPISDCCFGFDYKGSQEQRRGSLR